MIEARGELFIPVDLANPETRHDQVHDTHGAILKAKGRQGLLLPQVASDRNWTAEQFFQALALKTEVSQDVYADPSARVYVFRAQVIR